MEILQDELLDPAVVEQALFEASTALLATPENAVARLAAVVEQQQTVTTVISRLTAAISAGGELAPLVKELKAREQERLCLEQERQQLERSLVPNPLIAGPSCTSCAGGSRIGARRQSGTWHKRDKSFGS